MSDLSFKRSRQDENSAKLIYIFIIIMFIIYSKERKKQQ